jgi:hypothetical protein
LDKPAVDALVAAVVAAILGVVLAPFWSDFTADMKGKIGAPLVALIGIAILVGIFAFGLTVLHYFGVLGSGANPVGTRERADYDALRQRIAAGNWIEREYARKLNVFLGRVDGFFGDANMARQTRIARAIGLRESAPLWTASAFDRCLLLALTYPAAAIILIWAISGDVGPAEAALELKVVDPWRRYLVLIAIGIVSFSFRHAIQSKGFSRVVWIVFGGTVIGAVGAAVTGAVTVAGAVYGAAVIAGGFGGLFTGAAAFASGVGIAIAFVGAIASIGAFVSIVGALAVVVAVGPVVAGAGAFVDFLSYKSVQHNRQNIFLSLYVPFMFAVCYGSAAFLSHLSIWKDVGPMLLFLGLLTLINAPFDWLSLGLTRALMRRGLEREKWWPYFYAVIDALLASVVIAFLAMAMTGGTELFDDLAVYGGGARVLSPMREYLDAIKAEPGKPEYWWIYATLFSTMLPSLINLFIAGVSLARGVPGVSSWLLGKVRDGEAVPAYDRLLVAVVLTLQGVAGVVIAVVAQGFLFWVIIWQGMPRLGIGVLDLAYLVVH